MCAIGGWDRARIVFGSARRGWSVDVKSRRAGRFAWGTSEPDLLEGEARPMSLHLLETLHRPWILRAPRVRLSGHGGPKRGKRGNDAQGAAASLNGLRELRCRHRRSKPGDRTVGPRSWGQPPHAGTPGRNRTFGQTGLEPIPLIIQSSGVETIRIVGGSDRNRTCSRPGKNRQPSIGRRHQRQMELVETTGIEPAQDRVKAGNPP